MPEVQPDGKPPYYDKSAFLLNYFQTPDYAKDFATLDKSVRKKPAHIQDRVKFMAWFNHENLIQAVRRLEKDDHDINIYTFVPHEKQWEYLTSPAQIRCAFGGNRSGKTTVGSVDVMQQIMGFRPYLHWDHPLYGIPIKRRVWRIIGTEIDNHLKRTLTKKFHRIRFKVAGVTSYESFVFLGLEIAEGVNEGITKHG